MQENIILVAAIVSMVIGALWYSPALFGKIWIKFSGMDKKKLDEMKKKGMGKGYVIGFIATLVMAYVLAVALGWAEAGTVALGAQVGFWLWLGFIVPVVLGGVLWGGKAVQLFWVDISYRLVSVVVMGGILAVWV